jgi:hypothetical protein
MRILFTNSTLNIKDGTVVSGMSNQAETLNVTHGRVWVTIEGSPDDYWLAAGDALEVAPDRLVVIEAFREDSQVFLSHTQEMQTTRRAFDFFNTVPGNPRKTADAAAPIAQFGYTDNLCQQHKPQATPSCTA